MVHFENLFCVSNIMKIYETSEMRKPFAHIGIFSFKGMKVTASYDTVGTQL